VGHARTLRLDVRAGAIRADFCKLGFGELLARHPVEVAEVGAARGHGTTAGLGDQRGVGLLRGTLGGNRGGDGFAAAWLLTAGGDADSAGGMLRTGRQGGGGFPGRAVPATGGRYSAVELFGGAYVGS